MPSRRSFLKYSIIGLSGIVFSKCFREKKKDIKVSFRKTSSDRGHELWKNEVAFTKKISAVKDVVIIGGGISGLSSAYHLLKNGINDISIFELADHPGGNSASGKNQFSKYPYGAHYLTLPNPENHSLISFLHEKGIIQGFDVNGKPVYNETDLCFDPEERLFMRGNFQEGLIPNYGLSNEDKKETARFFKLIEEFKMLKGDDGNYFFNIPCSLSSKDKKFDHLDSITFEDYLIKNNFKNRYLLWYLNYCCRDDYGGGVNKISAWAGINYFAAHRANPSNTDSSRILTWPEGNNKLVDLLCENLHGLVQTGCLVKSVEMLEDKIQIKVLDFINKTDIEITCNTCIVAAPPFIAKKILHKDLPYPFDSVSALKHAPWMVATVTLTEIPNGRGMDICWDNVAFETRSLGYIYNQHQSLSHVTGNKVISIYMPLDDLDDRTARKEIENRSLDEWKKIVIDELKIMHPHIEENICEIEICIWGHGMILPSPGLLKNGILKTLAEPIANKIYFAHTDLSAYSVFEEGFDLGYLTAQKIKSTRA